ncbi:hypothetical protein ACFSTD_05165 [Novosphingobium colocasiae]|uniref:Uncharacterized protein n=1 Tax=Novosphingobium colocasiae TaxID=1256513 RepID=A0A918PED6_9SPHN|nr:hypothetical protein [Novosphingobium colocasiae]GGZ03550.1 hypothetical protein GCM10011614_18140 [Novosphingobium colocasiae]
MKKIAFAAFATAAALSLAACGGEAPAPDATESVETAPEEMMTGDATDAPSAEATAE